MTAPVVVTTEHLQRAHAQLRRHGTPSLEELRSYWVLFNCIRNRAREIAEGKPLPPEPTAAAPPAAQVPKPAAWPPAPRRRRDDAAPTYSSRAAAAGEYVHTDE